MIRIEFTATRAINGHAIGDPVTVTFSAVEPLTPNYTLERDTQKSLGNKHETLLHHGARSWNITTEPVQLATLDAIEEFLQAAADGSPFEFEPYWLYGAEPADSDAAETRLRAASTVTCVLGSEQYSLALFAGNGNGGADDWYQVSFVVEESA